MIGDWRTGARPSEYIGLRAAAGKEEKKFILQVRAMMVVVGVVHGELFELLHDLGGDSGSSINDLKVHQVWMAIGSGIQLDQSLKRVLYLQLIQVKKC